MTELVSQSGRLLQIVLLQERKPVFPHARLWERRQLTGKRLGRSAGLVDRAALAALARASVENWTALGPERALTGPIVRGDEETVARQREAVAERAPELVALFDALADATRALASEGALA